MSKFVVVAKAPVQLGKGEVVIAPPDFVEQIRAVGRKGSGKRNLTALNQLRDILLAIQDKFEARLNILKIPLSQYEGRRFESEAELGNIITRLLKAECPEAFEQILEYNIKHRPYGTKLVYYVGNHNETGPFFKLGLDVLEEKDIDEFFGRKPKKVVGKPAVTKEESEVSKA